MKDNVDFLLLYRCLFGPVYKIFNFELKFNGLVAPFTQVTKPSSMYKHNEQYCTAIRDCNKQNKEYSNLHVCFFKDFDLIYLFSYVVFKLTLPKSNRLQHCNGQFHDIELGNDHF